MSFCVSVIRVCVSVCVCVGGGWVTPPDEALKHCYSLLHGIYIASLHRQLNALSLELLLRQCHMPVTYGLNIEAV